MRFYALGRPWRIAIIACLTFLCLVSFNLTLSRNFHSSPADINLFSSVQRSDRLLTQELLHILEDDVRRHYDQNTLDLSEIKPYAQKFTALWNMHLQRNDLSSDDSLKQTISNIGSILYPWLTAGSSNSFMDFLESTFTRERGIVITSGRQQFRLCLHLVYSLRTILNTDLPIEIMYGGDDDLTVQERNLLANAGHDIRFVDVKKILVDPDNLIELPGSFAIKTFSMLVSSFRQVLLIDADGVFLQDPKVIFENKQYKDTGTLFFHDRIFSGTTDEAIALAKKWLKNTKYYNEIIKDSLFFDRKTGHEMESGVVLIDKLRTLSGLLLTCHMNLKRQREQVTTPHFYGDKETFWLGYGMSETRFQFTEGYAGGIGRYRINSTTHICTLQLLHFDESRDPLWINNSLLDFKLANDDVYARFEAWDYGAEPSSWTPDDDCGYPNEYQYGTPTRNITPVNTEIKGLLDKMTHLAKELDLKAVELGLISINHKQVD
ncbi:putative alpha-1,3-mannosyltransferase MNN14 [Neolecta irregularis DAH-3]|uniref:Putative alpha-1,3-mannosyltransferase MNN14 n=1 Tax=Neolecta irregularis (strain DAH-3) TaxID=1198029 RepID=A0A1U7LGP5_NEOID|nr:putative alpha-1,3-mannosyltransferase MNN14 [Neolecta irregularis DAH-3]|eukprot:OLL21798.1 putative alpha-1,3-mannosyltransferase MNN14 [Neolecta irregularis DAH-3]